MSIAIAVIHQNGKDVYLASDRKGADMYGNFIEEEFVKTHQISDNRYFTGNGVYQTCMQIKDNLLEFKTASEMIMYLDSITIETVEVNGKEFGDCTLVLAGVHDDGEPFIYARITKEAKGHLLRSKPGRIIYVLAVEDLQIAKELHRFLPEAINKSGGYELGILQTLKLSSNLSESIGTKYDFIHLQCYSSSET